MNQLKKIFELRHLIFLKWVQLPDVSDADENGLLCYGGVLDPSYIASAYLQGVFPWPNPEITEPLWFAPDPRGIIDFDTYKIPKSLSKFIKKNPYRVTFNQDFKQVIKSCQKSHMHHGVWITDEVVKSYLELFQLDLAYSVECWDKDKLVGGLYGVCIGNFFSAESMFYHEDNASKIALALLIEHLKITHAVHWIDTQMVTPVVESFGGHYIPRTDFMKRLSHCQFQAPKSQFFP